MVRLTQRNKFSVGDMVEIMKPNGENHGARVLSIEDELGEPVESAPHPKQVLWVKLEKEAACGDVLRMRNKG